MLKGLVLACFLAAGVASAQEWEVGGLGGFGYAPDLTVKGPSGSASTGLKNGVVIGGFVGDDTYDHWSGEAHYLYRFNDLKLSSGGASVDFGAHTHIVNGDILWHVSRRESRIRPFFAFGGGIKFLQGMGAESAAQPLGNFAALTHTSQILPMIDAGFGVKVRLNKSFQMRFQLQDYVSPAPTKVIAAAPGNTINGIWNDIQGTAAIAYTW